MRPTSKRSVQRSGFTLIELLAVIAIVALLAGILFPVLARTKMAAEKSTDLSNLKQLNLGATMYLSDHDDLYPLATPKMPDGSWGWAGAWDLPADLRAGQNAEYYELNGVFWANSIQLYVRSLDIYRAPNQETFFPSVWTGQKPQWVKKPAASSYAMNGMLEQYSGAAIARPSQLIAFSAPSGGRAIEGSSYASPYLYCYDSADACRYRPSRPGCDGSINGEWSSNYAWPSDIPMTLRPSFGNGSNYAYADGSAKFRRMFANANIKTDYRTDPFTQYNAKGETLMSWADENYCHPLLYAPDFDFEDFGSPVEGY